MAKPMADDSTSELKLHVTVGDISIEVEGSTEEVETWFEALRNDYLPPQDTDGAPTGGGEIKRANSSSGSEKEKTLAQIFKEANDPNKQESALLVGWYLEKQEDHADFTASEVSETAQTYKIPLGANISRDLGNQVGEGHLDQVGERDGQNAFHLTIPGEEYVEAEILGGEDD